MSCNVSGGNCRVCPGVWLAGVVLLGMLIQSVFFSASSPSQVPVRPESAPTAVK